LFVQLFIARMSKPISLTRAQEKYDQALHALDRKPDGWLAVLLARDQVDDALSNEYPSLSLAVIQQLNDLDQELREKLPEMPQEQLVSWKAMIHPSATAWWWEDKLTTEQNKQKEHWWEILTGTLLLLSVPLIAEIIKRFWDSTPDTISIFGTLLTLLLIASPLAKESRSAVLGVFKYLPWIKVQNHAKVMAAMSIMVFLVLLLIKQWLLPYPLATYYNNQGIRFQTEGNLVQARQSFQRAVAMNSDRVVPYYNLARAYDQTGLISKAEEWYQKAIEQDTKFVPAYRGLGEIFNNQGKYGDAEKVLIAGLSAITSGINETSNTVTHYELLSNLGWSYYAQGKIELAQEALISALKLEHDLRELGNNTGVEYRLALPHFYLAQIYERNNDLANAKLQWEESLRFLDKDDLHQQERYLIVQQHLQALTGK
jgi:tetratricopeptide (TPR) repeat protein